MSDNKLPEIMQNLKQQMGREPPPSVTRIEDYAPKPKDIKAEQISEGLRELIDELLVIQTASREKIDAQAELLARLHNLIAEMKSVVIG